jgi:hypothetical protein
MQYMRKLTHSWWFRFALLIVTATVLVIVTKRFSKAEIMSVAIGLKSFELAMETAFEKLLAVEV